MKVFACRKSEWYSGGLAIVAANSAEEAYIVLCEYFKGIIEDTIISWDYPKDKWFELPLLCADVDTPQVIINEEYSE